MSEPVSSEPVSSKPVSRDAESTTPVLPPAAVDITEFRREAEAAGASTKTVPIGLAGFVIAAAALVVALVLVGQDPALTSQATATLVAVGVAGVGVLFALLVVLPLQLVTRQRRRLAEAAVTRLDETAGAVARHLASIGYRIPRDAAVDWLLSSAPTATVPLVHDSVIAARWWRPTEGDDRVFLEPFLRQGASEAALPALAPVPPLP